MLDAQRLVALCREKGFGFFAGTPCSLLSPLINAVIDDPKAVYLNACNEGDAVAAVCGAALAGRKGVALFQNSGLGNAVNALTSLAYPYRFPLLLIVSLRGDPEGQPDGPQHSLMGAVTGRLLDEMRIAWEWFPAEDNQIKGALERIDRHLAEKQLPYALVVKRESLAPFQRLGPRGDERGERWKGLLQQGRKRPLPRRISRTEALSVLLRRTSSDDVVVTTTGKTSRELCALKDRENHFYMVGSMGCASSLALGLALNRPQRRVVAVDGDGALLMRMGNMALIGACRPGNLLHLLLDNESYDSTGGQETVSPHVSFAAVAQAVGYARAYAADDPETLGQILEQPPAEKGATFIHFRIKAGSPRGLQRPRLAPFEVKERLMRHLKSECFLANP
ncbi:MAG: phosphonopyruvate decarboxylase [Acidobacteriota bacterium]